MQLRHTMNLTIELNKPEMKGAFDWQLSQEINVKLDNDTVVAKAEIELLTLNKHRGAEESYQLLAQQDATDWEVPLNVYFKKQNVAADLIEKLAVKADNKAKTHILIEAISVHPDYRKKGVAQFLLQEIAKHHAKIQSISVLSMPMKQFVDIEDCESDESRAYYQALALASDNTTNEQLVEFFQKSGFIDLKIDDSALDEPLPYQALIASPQTILK